MIDGLHAGLPAGFTGFSASGVPDTNGRQAYGESCTQQIWTDSVHTVP